MSTFKTLGRLLAPKAKDWFKQASRDLEMAQLAFEQGYYEWTCFCAQQAGEKRIKSVLYELEIGLSKKDFMVHDLISISDYIPAKFIKKISKFNDSCGLLSDYVTTTRYPEDFGIDKYPGVLKNKTEAGGALAAVNEIFAICNKIVVSIKKFKP